MNEWMNEWKYPNKRLGERIIEWPNEWLNDYNYNEWLNNERMKGFKFFKDQKSNYKVFIWNYLSMFIIDIKYQILVISFQLAVIHLTHNPIHIPIPMHHFPPSTAPICFFGTLSDFFSGSRALLFTPEIFNFAVFTNLKSLKWLIDY